MKTKAFLLCFSFSSSEKTALVWALKSAKTFSKQSTLPYLTPRSVAIKPALLPSDTNRSVFFYIKHKKKLTALICRYFFHYKAVKEFGLTCAFFKSSSES
jgi:hypothetical protein